MEIKNMKSSNTDDSYKSWLDDIPVCQSTGIGFKLNEVYNISDQQGPAAYRRRDRSFFCKADDNTYLYAIFSGHNGNNVADFALERMAAEILLGQLDQKTTEEQVKDVIRHAFYSVERYYQESIETLLAEKISLQLDISSGTNVSEKYPDIWKKLNDINLQLSDGGSVVIALIHNSKLYISNVGNCRALLCRKDENNVLKVIQLTADHNLCNEDEILRLRQIGLDVQTLKNSPLCCTRCIGCYMAKGGYRECPYLSDARSEPVIAQPEIFGGQLIDDSFGFLLLISSGLCKSLQQIYSSEASQENKEIAQMTVEQFRLQSTLKDVAQSVVCKLVNIHRDKCLQNLCSNEIHESFKYREDVTFLIRNFNFNMPHAVQKRINQVTFNPYVEQLLNSNGTTEINGTEPSTISANHDTLSNSPTSDEKIIKNEKIMPYVDFSSYYENIETARANGTLPSEIDFD